MNLSIQRAIATAAANGPVTPEVVETIVQNARAHGETSSEMGLDINAALNSNMPFTPAGRDKLKQILAEVLTDDGKPKVAAPPFEKATYETFEPWSAGFWPMAPPWSHPNGTPQMNLWADGGPLDKFDALLKARGREPGALAFERVPALNKDVLGKKAGYYVPRGTLREEDAEVSTGIDFNGNGIIEPDVKYDFLNALGNFGKDGRTDGTMSVAWWGFCREDSMAGAVFQKPTNDVTLDGVTFTAQDIKGLLTVIVESQLGREEVVGRRFDARPDEIKLINNDKFRGKITTPLDFSLSRVHDWQNFAWLSGDAVPEEVTMVLENGETKKFRKAEIERIAREDKRDDAALFHQTIIDWLKTGRPAQMDRDNGDHVWTHAFYKAEDKLFKDGSKPAWVDENTLKSGRKGPAGDGKITYVERAVHLAGNNFNTQYYRYWLEEKDGQIVNSGWDTGSASPDYLLRFPGEPTFTGENPRNPFVDPAIVKELYEKSIATKPASAPVSSLPQRQTTVASNSARRNGQWQPQVAARGWGSGNQG